LPGQSCRSRLEADIGARFRLTDRTRYWCVSLFYFITVIVAEPVSGGLAESVAVTVMV